MMLHPNAERLLQFAEGVTPESDRNRVADHLATCERCRADVNGTREVQELLVIEIETAPEFLLMRVIDARARNELVLLPVERPEHRETPRSNRRIGILLGVGAAAIALMILVPSLPYPAATHVAPVQTVEIIPKETPAPPLVIDPSRLHPVELWYEKQYIPSDRTQPTEFSRYRIRLEAMNNAKGDWRLIHDPGAIPSYSERDTLTLGGSDLRPLELLQTSHYGKTLGVHRTESRNQQRFRFTDSTVTFDLSRSSAGYRPWKEKTFALTSPGKISAELPRMLVGPSELFMLMSVPFPTEIKGWRGSAAWLRVFGPRPAVWRVEYRGVANSSDGKTIELARRISPGQGEVRYILRRSDGLLLSTSTAYYNGDSVLVRLVTER